MTALVRSMLLVPLALGACLFAWPQSGDLHARDDFRAYPAGSDGSPNWLTSGLAWEARAGSYRFDSPVPGFAVWGEGPIYGRLTVEATLTVERAVVDDWKIAGISVYTDDEAFWHLALVESPKANGARRYVELAERIDGRWPAQSNLQMTAAEAHAGPAWEYGVPYLLKIELDPAGITGTITDVGGRLWHRIGYRFSARAVTRGRPALHAYGFQGTFAGFAAEGSEPTAPLQPPKPPAYSVATPGKAIGPAKGFFSVKEVDGTWWVVDPLGRAFYAVGTDHCRYGGHWCEKLGYAPYGRNMEKKFGSPEAWAASATERLKGWSFNLLGAGGDPAAYYRGLAHTEFIAFGATFSSISDLCPKTTWTGFPNVFDPKWQTYCEQLARRVCRKHRDDPWLLGYFLDNELEWYGKAGTPGALFDEAMKKPAGHSAKIGVVDFLRRRYKTMESFRRTWGARAESFDDLLKLTTLDDGGREEARRARIDFVRLVADRYFAVTTAAVRKADPNHLVIGCRFAGDAPARIWDLAGKYCDIVTFNYYGNVDLEAGEAPGLAERFTDYYRQAKRPLMITEWSFPALDSGLPCKHGAGQRFDTQTQRARAYSIFQTMVLSLPFMVGSDYFMWVDEPALGISSTFPEDTNYGLVNEQDEPYAELTQTAQRVNGMAHALHGRGVTDLRVGPIREQGGELRTELRNLGRSAVEVEVTIREEDLWRTERRALATGATPLVLRRSATPGGHFVSVDLDLARELADLVRSDNHAALAYYVPGDKWPASAPTGSARVPLAIANHGWEPLEQVPVTIRLGRLAKLPWEKIDPRQVVVLSSMGEPVRCQTDPVGRPLSDTSELCFIASGLPRRSCFTYFVTILPKPQATPPPPPAVSLVRLTESGLTLRNGELELRTDQPTGNLIDQIILNGTPLGRYNPLIWQHPGQDLWVETDRFLGAEASVGPVRAVLTLKAAGGKGETITRVDDQGAAAARERQPVPFEVTHQVIVYPRRPEFEARFVSLKNTGTVPLQLRAYFFYLLSAIGGDRAGDEEAVPEVPNYYAGGQGAWRDRAVGAVLGAEPWPGSDLQVHFWRDPGGAEHPDARRQLAEPLSLAPGQTYTEADAPLLIVYGAKGDAAPWRSAQQRLKARAAVSVEPGRAERR